MEKRNRYTAEFKAKVVLELLREEQTLNEVAAKYQLNPQMISQWKSDFVKNASVVFERNKDEAGKLKKEMEEKESRYQQIIGQQSYEIDWLKKKSGLMFQAALLTDLQLSRCFVCISRGFEELDIG
jgi:putative transposase